MYSPAGLAPHYNVELIVLRSIGGALCDGSDHIAALYDFMSSVISTACDRRHDVRVSQCQLNCTQLLLMPSCSQATLEKLSSLDGMLGLAMQGSGEKQRAGPKKLTVRPALPMIMMQLPAFLCCGPWLVPTCQLRL